MSGIDITVTVIYLVVIVTLGCTAGFLKRRRGVGEAKDYFLAGGTLRWPIIGLALFATNISCVHLVSLAQAGYDTGLLQGNFEWMAGFTLIMLGLLFAPFYIRSKVATLPDFLERRYCRACRDWLAVLSMISAVTIHIGFSFLAGGKVLEFLFDVNIYYTIFVIAALTGIYTIIGGLMAVVLTEAIQTVVLVIGASVITWFAWDKMGGWDQMYATLLESGETTKATMLRTSEESPAFPWFAIFLGYPVLGIWYWCADQTIVQRVLGARSEDDARVGPLFAGLIKILPVFIFVMPGLFAYTLAKSDKLDIQQMEIGRNVEDLMHSGRLTLDKEALVQAGVYDADAFILDVDQALERDLIDESTGELIRTEVEPLYDTKYIYAVMIKELLPPGLVGVMVAALLAALMSTVSGALNSISTLFSYDLYRRFKPDANDRQLVFVGRITALVALVLAIGLVPLLDGYPSIFEGLNNIIAHIAPPVTCVFVLGVFWPRASAISAKFTLWIGSALGTSAFLLEMLGDRTPVASWLKAVDGGSFMMRAFYLLCACVAIQVFLSLIWPAGESERSSKLYWSHPLEPFKDKGWPGIGNYKFLSALLIGIMCVLYYIFR